MFYGRKTKQTFGKERTDLIRFECDYNMGAAPQVLERLLLTNMEQTPGYSLDPYCAKAVQMIRDMVGRQEAEVHFLSGGTQTNATVIGALLRPYQGVLCSDLAHINVHETGAIEATGHKVLPLPSVEGKITAKQIADYVDAHWADDVHDQMVQPGMVYLSNSTEVGTIYTKAELEAISAVCREKGLYLYVDGARLGYALMAEGNDLTMFDLSRLCDVFYIGGTKQGALFGEAIVICNQALQRDFRYMIRRIGGLLAKGRLFGLQFLALLEEGLYFKMSQHANQQAMRIKAKLQEKGIAFQCDSPTNQQFVIFPNEALAELTKNFAISNNGPWDETHTLIRFCTSWATKTEDVDALLAELDRIFS